MKSSTNNELEEISFIGCDKKIVVVTLFTHRRKPAEYIKVFKINLLQKRKKREGTVRFVLMAMKIRED